MCRVAYTGCLAPLGSVTGSSSLLQQTADGGLPIIRAGKRYRGLNALAQKDHTLLLALARGEFALSGIRNADSRTPSGTSANWCFFICKNKDLFKSHFRTWNYPQREPVSVQCASCREHSRKRSAITGSEERSAVCKAAN